MSLLFPFPLGKTERGKLIRFSAILLRRLLVPIRILVVVQARRMIQYRTRFYLPPVQFLVRHVEDRHLPNPTFLQRKPHHGRGDLVRAPRVVSIPEGGVKVQLGKIGSIASKHSNPLCNE